MAKTHAHLLLGLLAFLAVVISFSSLPGADANAVGAATDNNVKRVVGDFRAFFNKDGKEGIRDEEKSARALRDVISSLRELFTDFTFQKLLDFIQFDRILKFFLDSLSGEDTRISDFILEQLGRYTTAESVNIAAISEFIDFLRKVLAYIPIPDSVSTALQLDKWPTVSSDFIVIIIVIILIATGQVAFINVIGGALLLFNRFNPFD